MTKKEIEDSYSEFFDIIEMEEVYESKKDLLKSKKINKDTKDLYDLVYDTNIENGFNVLYSFLYNKEVYDCVEKNDKPYIYNFNKMLINDFDVEKVKFINRIHGKYLLVGREVYNGTNNKFFNFIKSYKLPFTPHL
jgi:hypothetical protein